ncbi:hypothetical protein LOD99_7667 [Oopsacas minuta]|uniref:Regulatory protein SIR2 homolog 7 n=1 Tax=Oopsacas minuta TaxID=111878 RepID=A0AAV7JP97_9METZ|nr:hypothetical protein LOD99_7667 [Oopsacas minuta]
MSSVAGKKRKLPPTESAQTESKRTSTKGKYSPKEDVKEPDELPLATLGDNTGFICSACHLSISPELESRVEIKSSPPAANKLKTQWILKWNVDWSATLHSLCWDNIHKTAGARGKNKIQSSEKKMILEAVKTAEKFDSLQTLNEEAIKAAGMVLAAKHCICFTGAGISTSAGIGDYRGKDGKWTQEDRQTDTDTADEEGVAYEKLRPTYTHEAIAILVERGLIKHVISQNGDGLHLLSGLSPDNLSELHGNVFLEKCEKCTRVYERDYYTLDDTTSQYYEELEDFGKSDLKPPRYAKKCSTCGLNHRTGRRCQDRKCRGYLKDMIINFGDLLDDDIITRAETEANKNDLCLSLGSTMQVHPACDLVGMGQIPLKLAVCNRQETEFDDLCYKKSGTDILGVRVFGDCDVFMKEIMKQLIPPDELKEWEDKRNERIISYTAKRLQD